MNTKSHYDASLSPPMCAGCWRVSRCTLETACREYNEWTEHGDEYDKFRIFQAEYRERKKKRIDSIARSQF